MKTVASVGLLPLYLELYDRVVPERRADMEAFAYLITEALGRKGVEIRRCPICRLEAEFAREIERFGAEKVGALVTLHPAYSPSLESARASAETTFVPASPRTGSAATPVAACGKADFRWRFATGAQERMRPPSPPAVPLVAEQKNGFLEIPS